MNVILKTKRFTVFYALVQCFYWFCYGTALSYASPFLLSCGLSNTAIGLISAAACALSVAAQPLLAAYADREGSMSVKTLVLAMGAGILALGAALIFTYGKNAALNGLLLGSAILLVEISLPFVNALATETINAGKPLNYSFARGAGSVGYAIMSITVGQLIAKRGAGALPYALSAFALAYLTALAMFPFQKREIQETEKTDPSGGPLAFIKRYPAFAVTLAGCVLIFVSHVLINNFLYQIVVSKGGGSEHMGNSMALAGILEVLIMFSFAAMLKWKDSGFWFRISGVFFTIKALGTLLAPTMGALYLMQIFQPLGWGMMTVASVFYVNSIMKEQDRIKGQAYMTMALSVGTIIASLCGGWLIDAVSVNGMMIAAILCGAAGTLIVMRKQKA